MENDIIIKVSMRNSELLKSFSEVVNTSVDDLVNEALSMYFDIMHVCACRITVNLYEDGNKNLS